MHSGSSVLVLEPGFYAHDSQCKDTDICNVIVAPFVVCSMGDSCDYLVFFLESLACLLPLFPADIHLHMSRVVRNFRSRTMRQA